MEVFEHKKYIFISSSTAKVNNNSKKTMGKNISFLGSEYSVWPVVMIVEGAYYPNVSGSDKGVALYFPADELKKSLNSWQGRPASLNHPNNSDSFNSPDTFEKQWLGYVFNSEYDEDGKRLIADLWINSERGSNIIELLRNGKEIDVSIGAYGDIIEKNGIIKGVKYNREMINIIGDHLAILPDSVGACNWEDGCGVRIAANYYSDQPNDWPAFVSLDFINAIWDVTENQIRFRLRDPNDFKDGTFRTKKISGEEKISIIVGKLKDNLVPEGHDPNSMVIQSYRFEKKTADEPNGWTLSEAKEWIEEHINMGDQDKKVGAVSVNNILKEARTPNYDGVEDVSWDTVKKEIGDYVDWYYTHSKKSKPEDLPRIVAKLPQEVKAWVASKSLLGDPKADTARDLLFFPVVNPRTNKLNNGALRAVISGRGTLADIPDQARVSAQNKARSLLDKEFAKQSKELTMEKEGMNNIVVGEKPCCSSSDKNVNKIEAKSTTPMMIDEYLKDAPDPIKATLVDAIRERKEQRDKLISCINNVEGIYFQKSFLDNADTNSLKNIAYMANKILDIKVNNGGNIASTDYSLNSSSVAEAKKYVPITLINWEN